MGKQSQLLLKPTEVELGLQVGVEFNNIFLKSLYEMSNTFQALLNTYFRAFSDLNSCGSLGPPPSSIVMSLKYSLTYH